MNNKYDMDYDGMGNQGRFPSEAKRYESSAKGAFVGFVGIFVIVALLLLTSCYGTYYITDAEYSDLREEHAVTTFHNNQIYWGFHSGYYYYYGKPHYYPWYYYYNTCPPSYYNTTTHIIINKPVIKNINVPDMTNFEFKTNQNDIRDNYNQIESPLTFDYELIGYRAGSNNSSVIDANKV